MDRKRNEMDWSINSSKRWYIHNRERVVLVGIFDSSNGRSKRTVITGHKSVLL